MLSRRWRGTTVTISISARKDTSAWVIPGGRGRAAIFRVWGGCWFLFGRNKERDGWMNGGITSWLGFVIIIIIIKLVDRLDVECAVWCGAVRYAVGTSSRGFPRG